MLLMCIQIAARLGVTTDKVTNVIIWGNHSSTQFPDVAHAKVELNGQVVPVPEAVKDDNYLKNDFIKVSLNSINPLHFLFANNILIMLKY